MSELHEPARWLDAVGDDRPDPLLQDVLRAGQAELPSQARLGAIWAALEAGGPGGGDAGPSDAGPSDVGPSDVGPSDVGPSDVGPSDVGGDIGSAGPDVPDVSALGDAGLLGQGVGVATGGLSSAKIAGLKLLAVGTVAAAAIGGPVYLTSRSDEAALEQRAPATVQAPTVLALPPAPPPELAEIEPEPQSEPEPAPPKPPAVSPPRPSEIELLQQAQSALGSQPGRALALVEEAAQLYPSGALGQEREMIRIQALSGVGRRAEALAAARAFKERHPGSPHVRRLETLFPDL